MALAVLAVNPGSSSLKLSLVGSDDQTLAESEVETDPRATVSSALERFVASAPGYDAAAVRVVHGGPRMRSATLADEETVARLTEIVALAPLHIPPAIAALRALIARGRPVVACFDTAFHSTMPDEAALYAVPREWTERLGIRRYGFHGLSHAWAMGRAAALLDRPADTLRLVTCHLGAGASLAAVDRGRSIDTTMGFTPMEGLVMATRSGSVDPGAILHAQRVLGLDAAATERLLDRESGLLGISGRSGDLRELEAAAAGGDDAARRAIAVMLHRLRAHVGAMAASLDGLDALVFTGGIGEHSALVREAVCAGLGVLGVGGGLLTPQTPGDAVLSAPGAAVAVLRVHAREDRQMAVETRALLDPESHTITPEMATS